MQILQTRLEKIGWSLIKTLVIGSLANVPFRFELHHASAAFYWFPKKLLTWLRLKS